ncbi:MAG: membrane dipeptidase, partial [Anaerolineales bacterium]|nr:membrane dipeptidase [Anaerolineales bacterium]
IDSSAFRSTIDSVSQMLTKINSSDRMVQVTTVAEMEQAKRDNKVAIVLTTQDGGGIEDDPGLLEIYYKLGFRVMGITYSGANMLGAGCAELTREVQGLSYLGIEVVKEMNRLGILIDMSHAGDATTWDALKYSTKPVVFTHNNARSLTNTTRNKTDEQIKAMADKGGVIGVAAVPRMCNDDLRKATLDDMLDHLDYLVKLVGIDHVGIGLDHTDATERFEKPVKLSSIIWRERRPEMLGTWEDFFTAPYAKGIESNAMIPNITRGLVARNYSDDDILKILGGNWMRVFKEVTEG